MLSFISLCMYFAVASSICISIVYRFVFPLWIALYVLSGISDTHRQIHSNTSRADLLKFLAISSEQNKMIIKIGKLCQNTRRQISKDVFENVLGFNQGNFLSVRYMGEISQGVQSMEMMSYFSYFWPPVSAS